MLIRRHKSLWLCCFLLSGVVVSRGGVAAQFGGLILEKAPLVVEPRAPVVAPRPEVAIDDIIGPIPIPEAEIPDVEIQVPEFEIPDGVLVPVPPLELAEPGETLFVNAGGGAIGERSGREWRDDNAFLNVLGSGTTNVAFFTDEFRAVDRSGLADDTVPDALFRSERWHDGPILYHVRVPNGSYEVTAYFAEMCDGCVGKARGGTACAECARVMDVVVEGKRVVGYDQADAALLPDGDGRGAVWTATELRFDVEVADGYLNLGVLDRGNGNPPENASIKGFAIHRPRVDPREVVPEELDTLGGTLRVNAAGPEVIDARKRRWREDAAFVSTPSEPRIYDATTTDLSALRDPFVPPALFASERLGPRGIGYSIPAPNGIYRVVLYVAELCGDCVAPVLGGTGCSACDRRMEIAVEDQRVHAFSAADAALGTGDDGRGAVGRATEVAFHVVVSDETVDIGLGGAANGSEWPALQAFAVTRLDATLLRLGQPVKTMLGGASPSRLFLLDAPAGETVHIVARGEGAHSSGLYFRWRDIPTPGAFDQLGGFVAPDAQEMLVPRVRSEAGLLILDGRSPERKASAFVVSAESAGLSLASCAPGSAVAGSGGTLRARVRGTGFDARTTFGLVHRALDFGLTPSAVEVLSSAEVELAFAIDRAPRGEYDLMARQTDPDRTAVLEGALDLTAGEKGALVSFDLRGFGAYRRGEVSRFTLWYRNEGDTPVVAPIFKVTGPPDAELGLERDGLARRESLLVLGVDPGHPGSELVPSEGEREVHIYFRTSRPDSVVFEVSRFLPGRDAPIDWESLAPPRGLTPAGWEALAPALAPELGETWRDFHASIAARGGRLHRRGARSTSVDDAFRLAVRQALDLPASTAGGRLWDSATFAPAANVTVVARRGGVVRSYARSDRDGFFVIDWLEAGASYEIAAVDGDLAAAPGPLMVSLPAGDADLVGLEYHFERAPNAVAAACPDCHEEALPEEAPLPPARHFAGARPYLLVEASSMDPNEKRGPRRPEREGREDEVCAGERVEYRISFENLGGSAARRVEIRDDIDPALFDLYSFRYTEIVLPGVTESFPVHDDGGLSPVVSYSYYNYHNELDGDPDMGVALEFEFNPTTGELFCALQTIEPWSLLPPLDPELGFLAPAEQGSISFSLRPREDLDDGTELKNRGEIVFDSNAPIVTEVFRNTYRDCLPEVPRSPIPDSETKTTVETDAALGWRSEYAEEFDVYLWREGEWPAGELPPVPVAAGIAESGFQPAAGFEIEEIYQWAVVARNPRGEATGPIWTFSTATPGHAPFVRGEANMDGVVDISDAILNLSFQFAGFPREHGCPKSLDVDDNGMVDLTDPIVLLASLFLGQAPPAAPFPECGLDPTPDVLPCEPVGPCTADAR